MLREAAELVRYRDLVRQLVTRNIKVRYKRSVLGFLWSMLGPLLSMTALSLVFTQIFKPTTPLYPLYLFPGLLMWNFFAQTTSSITAEVIGGVELWKRIYTPRTAFAVATTVTGLVHLSLAMVPLILLMLVFGAPLTVALATAPLAALSTALFALGIGLAVGSIAGIRGRGGSFSGAARDLVVLHTRDLSTRDSAGAIPLDLAAQPDDPHGRRLSHAVLSARAASARSSLRHPCDGRRHLRGRMVAIHAHCR